MIKVLRTNCSGEFTSGEFIAFLKAHGIHHDLTTPYSSKQNSIARQEHRNILEKVRYMLHDAPVLGMKLQSQ